MIFHLNSRIGVFLTHIFLTDFFEQKKNVTKIGVIAKADEMCAPKTYACIKFLDSFKLMNETIETLVKSSKDGNF